MMLIELDKQGAEWVVVAYVSGDERMIEVVESGESPHVLTGVMISKAPIEFVKLEDKAVEHYTDPDIVERRRDLLIKAHSIVVPPEWFLPRSMSIYQCGKKSNHGLNYDESYVTFSLVNEIAESESKRIIEKYHQGYPGIREGHEKIRGKLSEDRTLHACEFPEPLPLHRKQRFLEAWGYDLFRRAYSFIPQATVGDITNRAMILFYKDRSLENVELLANGHDSLLFQTTANDWNRAAANIRRITNHLNPTLNYEGRSFQIGTELKIGKNWGGMRKVELSTSVKELGERLEHEWHHLD